MLIHCLRLLLLFLSVIAAPVMPTGANASDYAIAPQFEAAGTFNERTAPVRLNGVWGVIDTSGRWRLEPQFKAIISLGNDRYALQHADGWEIVSAYESWWRFNGRFEDVKRLSGAHFAVKLDGRWGVVHEPFHSGMPYFLFAEIGGSDGRFVTARDAGGWAVFEFIHNRVIRYGLPLADYDTRMEIERAYPPNEDHFIAKTREGEALIRIHRQARFFLSRDDEAGEPFDEEAGEPFSEVIEDIYLSLAIEAPAFKRFSEGMAGISFEPGAWGFYHASTGNVLWEGRFEDVREFSSGLAPVQIGGKWGYIDKRGRQIIAPEYDRAYPFRDGIAIVRKDGLRGFLHVSESVGLRVLYAPQFEDVYRFSGGLAPVKVDGLWGYIRSDAAWPNADAQDVLRIEPVR